jgi:hypothetical protein
MDPATSTKRVADNLEDKMGETIGTREVVADTGDYVGS